MSSHRRFPRSCLPWAAVLLLGGLAACDRAIEIRHPTPENVLAESRLAAVVRRTRGFPEDPGLRARVEQLRSASRVLTLGAADGTGADVFGMIEDVGVDGEGNLYVLDSRFNEVRVFDARGTFRYLFGGPGQGPNEFLAPEAIELRSNGEVLVADRGNRLKLFRRARSSYEYDRSLEVRYVPEDLCQLQDRIFTRGWTSSGRIIHEYSAAGAYVKSFGDGYRSPNWLARQQLSDGLIACSPEANVILSLSEVTPYLSAYSPEGRLLWVTRFADFIAPTIIESRDSRGLPTLEVRREESTGAHVPAALVSLPDGYVLIQLMHRKPLGDGEERRTLDTYLVEAATGKGAYVGSSLPVVMAAQPTRLFTFDVEPFPRLTVYQMSGAE